MGKIDMYSRVFAPQGGSLRLGLLLSMLWIVLCAPQAAYATNLAVLPLDKGAAGEAYDGLGRSLAGMIISDLAGAEGLTLVERQRLDALLAEIELGKSGFIDPKTASKMGKGVGAEVVLLGTYSVVDGQIALDARLVQVESGKVLNGAKAGGPIQDFISVEKELVEELLAALDARLDTKGRRLFYSNVPTEDWGAFTAYSRAEKQAAEGEIDAARKAFQEALAKDPDFVQAAEGLSALEALVSQTKASDRETRTNRYATAETAALQTLPDVRKRAKDAPWTPEELADLALRWMVLLNRGEDCDRYAEMIAYLDLVGWDPESHGDDHRFRHLVSRRAEALGLVRWDEGVPHDNAMVYEGITSREGTLWRDVEEFLFDGAENASAYKHQGLIWSLTQCHPESVQQKELATWRKRLRDNGMADWRERDEGLVLSEKLTVAEAWADGLDARLTSRSERAVAALVAAHPDPESRAHKQALRAADNVARHVNSNDHQLASRLGLTDDVIRARLEALADGKAPFQGKAVSWCQPGLDNSWKKEAAHRLAQWDEDLAENSSPFHPIRNGAKLVRTVGDMGCFKGVPAKVTSWEDEVAFARRMQAQRHPTRYEASTCDAILNMIPMSLAHAPQAGAMGKYTNDVHGRVLVLVQNRCLVETP